MHLGHVEKCHVVQCDNLSYAEAYQREGIMQGVEHPDPIFQKQNRNAELLEKKTQRQQAKKFSGDPHHFHVGSTTVIEIGVIILGENKELQICVTVDDVIDQAFRINTDTCFVFCDA